jgi:hypothetical protein
LNHRICGAAVQVVEEAASIGEQRPQVGAGLRPGLVLAGHAEVVALRRRRAREVGLGGRGGTLTVRASSSSANVILTVFRDASTVPTFVLANKGGGRYEGSFTFSGVKPGTVTVRSNLGGLRHRERPPGKGAAEARKTSASGRATTRLRPVAREVAQRHFPGAAPAWTFPKVPRSSVGK